MNRIAGFAASDKRFDARLPFTYLQTGRVRLRFAASFLSMPFTHSKLLLSPPVSGKASTLQACPGHYKGDREGYGVRVCGGTFDLFYKFPGSLGACLTHNA
jgi:hypothetical protein